MHFKNVQRTFPKVLIKRNRQLFTQSFCYSIEKLERRVIIPAFQTGNMTLIGSNALSQFRLSQILLISNRDNLTNHLVCRFQGIEFFFNLRSCKQLLTQFVIVGHGVVHSLFCILRQIRINKKRVASSEKRKFLTKSSRNSLLATKGIPLLDEPQSFLTVQSRPVRC